MSIHSLSALPGAGPTPLPGRTARSAPGRTDGLNAFLHFLERASRRAGQAPGGTGASSFGLDRLRQHQAAWRRPEGAGQAADPAATAATGTREGRNGPIGLHNPAMEAYEAFDPAAYASFSDAVDAAYALVAEDEAAYGHQMAARMLNARGGKAYQYWQAVDPSQTQSEAFGSISHPWVTAYNGGLQQDVQQDLIDGVLQWSDIPEHLQGFFFQGLRHRLSATGAYTGRALPTDVASVLHSLRVQQRMQLRAAQDVAA